LKEGVTDGDDGWAQIRAFRALQHDRLQRRLFESQKNANLRSGARGYQARKDLIILEKVVEEAGEKSISLFSPFSCKTY
jgi:ATP-binding cassette, subfamily F, member 3